MDREVLPARAAGRAKGSGKYTVRVQAMLDPEVVALLEYLERSLGATKSEVIRRAVRELSERVYRGRAK